MTTPSTMQQALDSANVNAKDFPDKQETEDRPAHRKGRIILNSDGRKLHRSAKSEHLRIVHAIEANIQSLKDYMHECSDEELAEPYREREGNHPISFNTELRSRLTVLRNISTQVNALFEFPQMVPQGDSESK